MPGIIIGLPQAKLHILETYLKSRSFNQDLTSFDEVLEGNLLLSCQFPVPAILAKSSLLWPIPDDEEVQNGITVFPEKSLPLTKLSTGQAAIAH